MHTLFKSLPTMLLLPRKLKMYNNQLQHISALETPGSLKVQSEGNQSHSEITSFSKLFTLFKLQIYFLLFQLMIYSGRFQPLGKQPSPSRNDMNRSVLYTGGTRM